MIWPGRTEVTTIGVERIESVGVDWLCPVVGWAIMEWDLGSLRYFNLQQSPPIVDSQVTKNVVY